MEPEGSLLHSRAPATCPYPAEPDSLNLMFLSHCVVPKDRPSLRPFEMFRNDISFYGEEFLASRPTPTLEDYPLSAVHNCLLIVFASTQHMWGPFLHPQPEDRTWWQGPTCRGLSLISPHKVWDESGPPCATTFSLHTCAPLASHFALRRRLNVRHWECCLTHCYRSTMQLS